MAFSIKFLDNIINPLMINLEKASKFLICHTDVILLFALVEIHQFPYFCEHSL